MLEKGVIVPNIHFDKPNKKISFKQVDVPTTTMAWPVGLQRRASVNSFGYGGQTLTPSLKPSLHPLDNAVKRTC
jgi:acyl transferase domain-containing protein